MSKEVYGIFQGQYSDWKCIGCFDDVIDAYKYCNLRNKDMDDYDQLYVMPIRKIECDLSKIPDGYFVYVFHYHNRNGKFMLYPDYCNDDGHCQWAIDERLAEYRTDYFMPVMDFYKNKVAAVKVCVRNNDMAEAQKIADRMIESYESFLGSEIIRGDPNG